MSSPYYHTSGCRKASHFVTMIMMMTMTTIIVNIITQIR